MKNTTLLRGVAAIIFALSAALACPAQENDASVAPEKASAQSVKKARVDRSDDAPIVGRKRVTIKQSALGKVEEGARPLEREIVGREIADYRTISGAGKYSLEDECGFLRAILGDAI
jgi:hypothetical protein